MKIKTTVIDGVKYVRARAIAQEVKSIRKGLQKTRGGTIEESTKGWKLIGDGLNRLEEAVTEEKKS